MQSMMIYTSTLTVLHLSYCMIAKKLGLSQKLLLAL